MRPTGGEGAAARVAAAIEALIDAMGEDQASGGSPDEWVAELAGYRGGSTEDVVVLALVGRRPDNPCGAVVNSRLLGFARRFGAAGYVDDICAESYDGFFSAALPVIAEACAKR